MMTRKTTALPNSDSISIAEDASAIVGVIDLKNGAAVQAVQGNRDQYMHVDFCSGDPTLLLDHYLRLGIRRIYIADLDAITCDQPNADLLFRLASNCASIGDCIETIIDLGWRGHDRTRCGKLIERINTQFSQCQWIAATESMPDPNAISELSERVGTERTILSLDYFDGRLLAENPDEKEWVMAAANAGIDRFLVLDLVSVGAGLGPATLSTCKRIGSILGDSQISSDPKIYSGGGIRSRSDIKELSAAGCDRFLLATALYPQDSPKRRNAERRIS